MKTITIDDLLDELIQKEGGFTKDPKDRAHYGKANPAEGQRWDCFCTNLGITQATLSDYYGRQATEQEVRNLTVTLAREIYERVYLTGPRIDTLPALIAPAVFDFGVNSGSRRAIRVLQELVNKAGFGPIGTDGAIGPKTREAVAKACQTMGPWFVNAYQEERRQFLEDLIRRDPSQERFRNGWMTRVASFELPITRSA